MRVTDQIYIKEISSSEYLEFFKKVYASDQNFKDNKSDIFEIVRSGDFYSNSTQKLIAACKGNVIHAACLLIIHKKCKNLLTLSFFEALPDSHETVQYLFNFAGKYGRENGCEKMVVGLDGHINNSVAFPINTGEISFGSNYCLPYYHDYFEGFNAVKFLSYKDTKENIRNRLSVDMKKFEKITSKITLEYAGLKSGFNSTMKRYTDLNNEIFPSHKYYFERSYQEDLELLGGLRLMLSPKNLIFAKIDGDDVGFILYYPDFNELVGQGKKVNIWTYVKYKILKMTPKSVKVMEIGVIPKYRRYGVILRLFYAAVTALTSKVETVISSWIMEENTSSRLTTERYAKEKYKDFYVYEKEL